MLIFNSPPLPINMELRPRILLACLFGAAVMGGYLLGSIHLDSANASGNYVVTTSEGITRDEAVKAFFSEAAKNKLDLRSVLVFVKSGGSESAGQKPQVLRMDMPVKAAEGEDLSFQYFVDVSDDATPYPLAHCADVRLHVYLGGAKVHTTPWMGYENRNPSLPMQTEKITIHDVPAGWRDIGLIAETRGGGCNTNGYLFAWGGTAVVYE